MAITDTITINIAGSDGSRIQSSSTETGSTQITIDISIPAGVTNQLVPAAFLATNVQAALMLSSQPVTVRTNSPTAPGNTLLLKANIALSWGASAGYYPNPFTVDVTAFYVSTTASTRFQAVILNT